MQNVVFTVEPQCNSALIAGNDGFPSRVIEHCDGRFHARQDVKIIPLCNIFTLWRLAVDYAVPVKEDVAHICKLVLFSNVLHHFNHTRLKAGPSEKAGTVLYPENRL